MRGREGQDLSAGTVGRPHGLDGSFHLRDPRPGLLREGLVVTVAGRAMAVRRLAGTPQRPIVGLEGCRDRTAAEALRGQPLWVQPAAAPRLGEGEWWAEELEGCRVVDGPREVGVVRRLLALPSCEALEVDRGTGEHLLVPLVADAVRAVDVDHRRIEVDLGFLAP